MLFLTAVIALFTVLIWGTYSRMNWLIGAQASHSLIALQIDAQAKGIKLVWWDFAAHPSTLDIPEHGKEIDRQVVYIGMPQHLRKPANLRASTAQWLNGGDWVWPN